MANYKAPKKMLPSLSYSCPGLLACIAAVILLDASTVKADFQISIGTNPYGTAQSGDDTPGPDCRFRLTRTAPSTPYSINFHDAIIVFTTTSNDHSSGATFGTNIDKSLGKKITSFVKEMEKSSDPSGSSPLQRLASQFPSGSGPFQDLGIAGHSGGPAGGGHGGKRANFLLNGQLDATLRNLIASDLNKSRLFDLDRARALENFKLYVSKDPTCHDEWHHMRIPGGDSGPPSATVVPEPSTVVLTSIGTGMLLLGFCRAWWRRKLAQRRQ